jgi:RNA polymerase sigma factor (sigma-70 family)
MRMIAEANDTTALIKGCLANKRWAQEQLYRQYYRYAMAVALRYARDEMDAADIMSHAFVKIFKSIHSFDPEKGTLQAWIRRIVINEGLDHIKSRERFSQHVEIESVPEPEISSSILEQMGADEIMTLIHKLPPATHAVFVLYAVEGYTHREIGKKLGISEGTSKWHLSEARKLLQQQIRNIYPA